MKDKRSDGLITANRTKTESVPSTVSESQDSTSLSSEDLCYYSEVFAMFDTDHSGAIDLKELQEAVSSIGMQTSEAGLKIMMQSVTGSDKSEVSLNEFLKMVSIIKNQGGKDNELYLQEAFEALDVDNNGFISASDLFKVLEDIDESLPADQIYEMLAYGDDDFDGKARLSQSLLKIIDKCIRLQQVTRAHWNSHSLGLGLVSVKSLSKTMIFMISLGIISGQLIWQFLRFDLGIGLFSFLTGIIFTLVTLSILLIELIKWLPRHLFPYRIGFAPDQVNSGQLEKSGWIRISTSIIKEKYLFNEPFDYPNHLGQSTKPLSQMESAIHVKNYIIDRFHGVEPSQNHTPTPTRNWRNVYATLKHQILTLYSSSNQEQILLSINMPDAKIKLVGDSDYHYDPILLKSHASKLYLYCPTSSEKEDWFCKLARCRKLPNGFNQDKVMEFYRDLEPVRSYESGMHKLQETLKDLDSDSPVWLNALLGRAFISIHSNPRIKSWIMDNITKRMAHVHRNSTSFLGDIIIKDLDVGNSLPIISNPHLLAISNEGDMEIELDLDYTGGISLEAAMAASISVTAWTDYMRPINVPIVVRVSITSFSARMLLKVKPLWETNRIWFGFYRHPELKLELNLEPIISDKLVKIELVNQVIEARIKHALEEFVILPNMDSFVFWPFHDGLEEEFDSSDEEVADQESSEIDGNEIEEEGEEIEKLVTATNDFGEEMDIHDDVYLNYIGEAAYKVGKFVRDYRIDDATKSVVKKIASHMDFFLGPTVNYLQDASKPCRDLVIEETKSLGLDLVDRLGLKPEKPLSSDEDQNSRRGSPTKTIRKSNSRILDVMGLKISTHAPEDPELDLPRRHRKKNMHKISSEPNFKRNNTSELEQSECESSMESMVLSDSAGEVRKSKSAINLNEEQEADK